MVCILPIPLSYVQRSHLDPKRRFAKTSEGIADWEAEYRVSCIIVRKPS
jgi:hypothetical protein